MMPSGPPRPPYQAQHPPDYQNPVSPPNALTHIASPMAVSGQHNFGQFNFPYSMAEDMLQDFKMDTPMSDPFSFSAAPSGIPISASMAPTNPVSYVGMGPGPGPGSGHARSLSGASEEQSPASMRARGSIAGLEPGFMDDYGMNIGMQDGVDTGGRAPQDQPPAEQAPAWSELKTKAGKERKRLPLACIACRRKKIRCSGEKPACKHCLRSRVPCVYKVTTRKAAPRTDYMAMLDKRLKRMEERIIKIVPKEDQETPSTVPRANVKPGIPGTAANKVATGKKRGADDAFGPELDAWAKSPPVNPVNGSSSKPSSVVIQDAEENKLLSEGAGSLPSKEIQEHLAEVFFEHVYGQTYHVLHKPSYMRKLHAGTVPPVLVLSVCACAARFSQHPSLTSNPQPAFLRGEDWATEAREIVIRRYEWPNITILTCLLILGLHEFGTCQGGRSWAFGGLAIRMAYALQLHLDLDYDPQQKNGSSELSFIDREIRRRTMWACFLMDRFNSSGTDRPTFIKENTIKIQLPVKEQLFQMDLPGPTENLKGEVPHPATSGGGQLADPKQNMGVAAFMIKSIALWGLVISYLNQGGSEQDEHPFWHHESRYAELIKKVETFRDDLPADLEYTPDNLHAHETEGLANQFLFLHITIQQNFLFMYRFAVPMEPGGRPSKEAPKDFITMAGRKAFEAAGSIAELLRDGENHFVTAPFTGYCAFLASTVLISGAFCKSPAFEATCKKNLTITVRYMSKMKKYWGMFHFMTENLRDQYKNCADGASSNPPGSSESSKPSIFQYGDWFDRYPHGVSKVDFEDPAAMIKKEKGDDAVLEHKTEYETVEEFFQSLEPMHPQDRESASSKQQQAAKRKSISAGKKPGQGSNDLGAPGSSGMPPMQAPNQGQPQAARQVPGMPQQPMPQPQHHNPQAYNHQISPTTQLFHGNHPNFYQNHELLLPAQHTQGMLPQLDRQMVFNAYAGMGPGMPNGMGDHGDWDMLGGQNGPGAAFENQPSSAWFMPFNMAPPEIGGDAGAGDMFGMGSAGTSVGGWGGMGTG